ncbi:MAG: hypothetical protein ACK5MP_06595 [Nostocoides sp.]
MARMWGWLTGWVAARPLRHLLYAAAALVLVISAPFGGLAKASGADQPTDGIPSVAVGAEVDATPLRISVTKAVVTAQPGGTLPEATGGSTYLLVGVEISTTDSETNFGAVDALRLRDVGQLTSSSLSDPTKVVPDEEAKAGVYVVKDGSRLGGLGPGLTFKAAYVFSRASAKDLPENITVVLYRHTYRAHRGTGQMGWFDPTPVAEVTVPLAHPTPQPSSTSTAGTS